MNNLPGKPYVSNTGSAKRGCGVFVGRVVFFFVLLFLVCVKYFFNISHSCAKRRNYNHIVIAST